MKCNPIATKKNYRSLIFSKIPGLTKLDGIVFSDQDQATVEHEDQILSIPLILECSKEQRKGYDLDSTT